MKIAVILNIVSDILFIARAIARYLKEEGRQAEFKPIRKCISTAFKDGDSFAAVNALNGLCKSDDDRTT